MNIRQLSQQTSPGALITLFQIDLTSLYRDGQTHILYIAPFTGENATIKFGGKEYLPAPIIAEGFEIDGQGRFPTPKIKISNIENIFGYEIAASNDLLGCTVRRLRTFDRYLDDKDTADSSAIFPIDEYRIERRSSGYVPFIELELSAVIDQKGTMLPRRQILKNNCTQTYRRYVQSEDDFDYRKCSCPYSGSKYYRAVPEVKEGKVVESHKNEDMCGKRLSDCRLRFGDEPLPFNGFPGADDLRT